MCMEHDRSSHGLKVKVTGQVQRRAKYVCYTSIYYKYRLMAVAVGFDGDAISCELARRGVRHGAAEASARGRGNAVEQI